jgi:hypothetical protein
VNFGYPLAVVTEPDLEMMEVVLHFSHHFAPGRREPDAPVVCALSRPFRP